MDNATRDRLTAVAIALRPLLNRVVFHGLETCRELLDDPSTRVRSPAGRGLAVRVLTTVALDRLGPELATAGLTRIRRTVTAEEWALGESIQLTVMPCSIGPAESPDAVAREYAVLLTRSVPLGVNCSIRISTLPAQIAVLWCAHASADVAFTDSEPLEEMIEIIVRRRAILEDIAGVPFELRALIAQGCRTLLAHDGFSWVLRRALPDARQVPAVAVRARDRFVALAALGSN